MSNAWEDLRGVVMENRDRMKEHKMEELVKDNKSNKKVDTYDGAEQAFTTVLKLMEEVEEHHAEEGNRETTTDTD